MKIKNAIDSLAALAHETRLHIFRRLVRQGCSGLSAGEIGKDLGAPAPTVSFHLKEMTRSGLISCERQGRHLIYRADFDHMSALLNYLMEDCCQGALQVQPQTQTASLEVTAER